VGFLALPPPLYVTLSVLYLAVCRQRHIDSVYHVVLRYHDTADPVFLLQHKMFCGLEFKVAAFKTLRAHCQGVSAVCSELKHKYVGITYSTKRLEYYTQYFCV